MQIPSPIVVCTSMRDAIDLWDRLNSLCVAPSRGVSRTAQHHPRMHILQMAGTPSTHAPPVSLGTRRKEHSIKKLSPDNDKNEPSSACACCVRRSLQRDGGWKPDSSRREVRRRSTQAPKRSEGRHPSLQTPRLRGGSEELRSLA